MKDKLLPREEQLHTASSPAPEFSLEDIMAEFGSAPPPAPPPEEPELRIWTPRE